MKLNGLSTRSKVLYSLLGILSAIGFAFVLAVLISLGGYYLADWENAPVPEMSANLVIWALFALLPMLALRVALHWSLKKDRNA